jgi:outer membrane receptor protein involved in Fe transport
MHATLRLIACFLLFLSPALKAATTDTTALNEVVVTSSKNNLKAVSLPASVSLLPSARLERWNIGSIKDISAAVPNLFFPDYGSRLTSPVYIRGIGSKINAPSIGLYVDGIPYFEKSVFDFEFNEIEQIEVLRGPQGTLFGRNTMGGIIHVITKDPLQHQGGKLSLTGGDYGRKEGSASYYGKVTPQLGYALSGKYHHNDGYFTNRYTGKKADKLDAFNGSGKLYWKPNSHLSLQWVGQYDDSDQDGYPYAKIDSVGSKGTIGAVNYDSVSSYRRKIFANALSVQQRFATFQIKSVTGLQTLSDVQAIDQDFSSKPTSFVTQKQHQHLLTEELEARSTTKGRYEWLLGVFAFDQSSTSHLQTKVGSKRGLKDYETPTRGWALYHQSTLNDVLVSSLSLTAGIRYDNETSSQDYLSQTLEAGSWKTVANLHTRLSFSEWSPKISIRYQLNGTNSVYASVSKGYKTGGFNTSFDSLRDQSFKPEFSWNYEIGHKYDFFHHRLTGEYAFFYTDWKNQQVSQPLASGVGSLQRNAGRSYSMGAECSGQVQLTRAWQGQFSYGYTQARYTRYQSGRDNFADHYIPFIPRHTLLLGNDYTLEVGKRCLDRAVLSCQYVETGTLCWNDKNNAVQDTYGQWNGKLSLVRANVTLDLWVKNALNTEYTAFYFEMKPNAFAQKGKPRTLGANLTLYFR